MYDVKIFSSKSIKIKGKQTKTESPASMLMIACARLLVSGDKKKLKKAGEQTMAGSGKKTGQESP